MDMLDNETALWVECSILFFGREEQFAQLLKRHGTALAVLQSFGKRADQSAVQRILADCRENGIDIITQTDRRFPSTFFAAGSPVLFYAKGDLSCLSHAKTAGIIGARKAAGYSLRVCDDITRQLVQNGLVIVSGFAKGIDRCAHTSCLKAGGKTVAVLGCGIGTPYPKGSLALQSDIAKSGVVISEYPPLTPPKPENFPRRNRLIAAISDKLLVVEASGKSGCLNTVNHALQQGKDVYVLPPFDIKSESCQGQAALIRDGAQIAFEASDLL